MTRTATTYVVALGVLLGAWALTHHTTASRNLIVDTPIYQKYGDAMAHGRAPYRDIRIEYPPGALPTFVLPSLGRARRSSAYDRWFDREMALAACLVLLGVVLITRALPAIAVVAVAPILLGPVVLSRFDYWPTALAILALATLLRRRLILAAVLLGAAISAKVWPAVLLPFMIAWTWRTRGRRTALTLLAGVIAVVAAIIAPFAVLSPGGVWYSIHQTVARPLQIESLGSAVLVLLHHLFATNLGIISSYGSQNVGGWGAGPVAVAMNALLFVALVAVFVVFIRAEPSREHLVTACAAAVTALLAFGKVFSPQYMVWIVPFVAVVPSVTAGVLLVVGLLLTQAYFPQDYWKFADYFYMRETLEVLVRDLVVVALFTVLFIRLARRGRAPLPESRAAAEVEPPVGVAHRAA